MSIISMEHALKTHELNVIHNKLIASVPYEKAIAGLQQNKKDLVTTIVVDKTFQ